MVLPSALYHSFCADILKWLGFFWNEFSFSECIKFELLNAAMLPLELTVDRLFGWSIAWLIGDGSSDWFFHWSIHYLIDWLIDWAIVSQAACCRDAITKIDWFDSECTSIQFIARRWFLLNIFTKSIKQTFVRENKHPNFQNGGVGGRIHFATLREKVAIIVACLRGITEPLLVLPQSTKCLNLYNEWLGVGLKIRKFSSETK